MKHLEYQGVYSGSGSWGGQTEWFSSRDEATEAAYREGCNKDRDSLSIRVRYVGPTDVNIVLPADFKDWYGKTVVLKAGTYPVAEVLQHVAFILDRGEGHLETGAEMLKRVVDGICGEIQSLQDTLTGHLAQSEKNLREMTSMLRPVACNPATPGFGGGDDEEA